MMRACFAGVAALILHLGAIAANATDLRSRRRALLREKCGDCHARAPRADFLCDVRRGARTGRKD
jgi:hypothetical protein